MKCQYRSHMIFYNSDGSINFSKSDHSFGWNISDCDLCGNYLKYQIIPSSKYLLKKLVTENIHNNVQIGYIEEITAMLITIDSVESNILLSIISGTLYEKMKINTNPPQINKTFRNNLYQTLSHANVRDTMLSNIGNVDRSSTSITADLSNDGLSADEYRVINPKERKCW